ncbi:MAG: hypothetical protein AN485_03195 [Anabaena sp. MDT14b]|jgi:hypothetical protein|nr:MAG: hypothetical protein AN485_03195 [Anabaena sp. MDT14b]
MRNQSKILFCCKLTVLYVLAKLKFLHVLLPKELKNELPIDWNNRMFWTAFQSGGQKIYFDYYSELKKPVSYEPKIKGKIVLATIAYLSSDQSFVVHVRWSFFKVFTALNKQWLPEIHAHFV